MIKKFSLGLLVLGIIGSTYSEHINAAQSSRGQSKNAQSSTQQTSGFFGGMAIGAVVAGPPGALVGSIVGVLIGDGEAKKRKLDTLAISLSDSERELIRVRTEAAKMQQDYQLALQQLQDSKQSAAKVLAVQHERASIDTDNTGLSVHFRTGSSSIEPQYLTQLQSLVRLANQVPDTVIEITGFADRNGDEQVNLALSRSRSNVVQAQLKIMGIKSMSTRVIAYGESEQLYPTQSLESDFFERRVDIRLRDTSKQLLSHSGN